MCARLLWAVAELDWLGTLEIIGTKCMIIRQKILGGITVIFGSIVYYLTALGAMLLNLATIILSGVSVVVHYLPILKVILINLLSNICSAMVHIGGSFIKCVFSSFYSTFNFLMRETDYSEMVAFVWIPCLVTAAVVCVSVAYYLIGKCRRKVVQHNTRSKGEFLQVEDPQLLNTPVAMGKRDSSPAVIRRRRIAAVIDPHEALKFDEAPHQGGRAGRSNREQVSAVITTAVPQPQDLVTSNHVDIKPRKRDTKSQRDTTKVVQGRKNSSGETEDSCNKSEIHAAPSIAAASSPHVSNWQWCNDQGSFSYYSSDVSSKLTTAYQSNPKGSVQISICGTMYIIDFAKMVQINPNTGYSRPIVSMLSAASDIQWVYQEGSTFLPYTAEDSKALESMYQSNSPQSLGIRGNTYTFDFNQMCQANVSSGYKRQIDRRQIAASAAGRNADGLTLTLQGLSRENLAAAEATVLAKLQDSVKSLVIESLPKNMPADLEKKIHQIANKNAVMCSFEERLKRGKKHRVLKLEGFHFKLQTAVSAIQEEILAFHANWVSPEEEFTPPLEWVNQTKTTELFNVPQGSPEWQLVEGEFAKTMGANKVSSISRIQNTWIWKKYAFQKKRMHTKNGGRVNEMQLFHGTGTNDPKNIYEGEDGFDMRYSRQGLWGVANYFAVNASYSHSYAHTSSHGRQMFLVKVLTGDSHGCPSNNTLRMPPAKTSPQSGGVQMAGAKYDTVTGNTGGSQVFMTYDNDKAYPAYLITYSNSL